MNFETNKNIEKILRLDLNIANTKSTNGALDI